MNRSPEIPRECPRCGCDAVCCTCGYIDELRGVIEQEEDYDMSDDIQDDLDSAAEGQQMLEQARRHRENDPDVRFWAGVHDEAIARHRAEASQLKALNWMLDRLFL